MLVLSRKKGEEIFIGDHRVVVVEVRGNKVRLGVEAPRGVPVHRGEIRKMLEEQQAIAAAATKAAEPTAPHGLGDTCFNN